MSRLARDAAAALRRGLLATRRDATAAASTSAATVSRGRRARAVSTTTTTSSSSSSSAAVDARDADADAADEDAWETVVGLELHAQVAADTKLFSGAARQYGARVNANVAPFDAALPGSLPSVNARAVELATRLGVALGGEIHRASRFERKHYAYPDLPHGYQITQRRDPIVRGGRIDVDVGAGATRRLRIEQIQLEMDTGKSVNKTGGGGGGTTTTTIDLNRAGCALVEIVTRPDLRGGEEAAAAAEAFQKTLRFLGVGDANMEEGSLRVDVNVSVRRRGDGGDDGAALGERCEVKNLNSFRSIASAVRFEARRHRELIARGENVERETRSFDPANGETAPLRGKEQTLDYRFTPEPDVPPIVLSDEYVAAIARDTPELPDVAIRRLADVRGDHALPLKLATAVATHASTARYYEAALSAAKRSAAPRDVDVDAAAVARFVVGELTGEVKRASVAGRVEPLLGLPARLSPERVGELLAAVAAGETTARMAKGALRAVAAGDERGWRDVVDALFPPVGDGEGGGEGGGDAAVEAMCRDIVCGMPEEVALFKAGKTRLMGKFVGEAMRRTNGRADPKVVSRALTRALSEEV